MSSYLSFYLVPKKTKLTYTKDSDTEQEIEISKGVPLLLMSYSRNSDIYQAYYENVHPAYAGMDPDNYTELTHQLALFVVDEYKEDVEKTEQRLKVNYKMLKENYNSELWQDIQSMEEYLTEQKGVLEELKWVANLVYEVTEDFSDFEKVLINID